MIFGKREAVSIVADDGSIVAGDGEQERTTFSESVRPLLPRLARLAGRLAPTADSDDIVQEALTRAWRKRSQFDPGRGSLGSWLFAITADRARKARRPRLLPLRLSVQVDASSTDDRIDVERAVARLAPRQRDAINCFYFAGLSVAETAAAMGCSEGTVKSTLSDARARLKEILEGGR